MPKLFETFPSRRFLPLLALPISLLMGSGCVIFVDQKDPPPAPSLGDVTFTWAYDGETRCDNAGIKDLRAVISDGDQVLFDDVIDCVGDGATLGRIEAGTHSIELTAFNFTDEERFSGRFTIEVLPDVLNDLGELNLASSGPAPVVGGVDLLWSFLYPTSSPETDCATAGVLQVDVEITPASNNTDGQAYGETFACGDDGVSVSDLAPGDYTLHLYGYGSFNNEDLLLYESGDVAITVSADQTLSLGDVSLPRDDANFSDVDVGWMFSDTCSNLGITDLNFSITRVGASAPADIFTAACDADSTSLRNTFVPGDYVVDAQAQGTAGTFVGTVTINTAPGMTTVVDLNLVAQ